MIDTDSLSLCVDWLLDAAQGDGSAESLAPAGAALARDLSDVTGEDARAFLSTAFLDARARLDASELDAIAFAHALRRLTRLHSAAQDLLAQTRRTSAVAD